MPNNVRGVLTFKHLKRADIDFLFNTITSGDEGHIDFDLIIPEPRTKDECPKDCLVNKYSCVEEVKDKPWFDWYTWRNKYWGTKWGAYDQGLYVGDSVVQFTFSTAWSMPTPIIKRLTLLGFDFEFKWADEDLGSNCGKITYSSEQGWNAAWGAEAAKDTVAFARRVWSY